MDFKFTFEDGSEALAHYGVKGMKWGKHLKLNLPDISGGGGGMIQDEDKQHEVLAKPHDENKTPVNGGIAAQLAANVPGSLRRRTESTRPHGDVAKPHNGGIAAQLAANAPASLKKPYDRTARRNAYQKESRLNKMEYHGDRKGYKKAQARTDAFYGKKGANAAATETGRRLVNRFVSRTMLAATQNSKKRA